MSCNWTCHWYSGWECRNPISTSEEILTLHCHGRYPSEETLTLSIANFHQISIADFNAKLILFDMRALNSSFKVNNSPLSYICCSCCFWSRETLVFLPFLYILYWKLMGALLSVNMKAFWLHNNSKKGIYKLQLTTHCVTHKYHNNLLFTSKFRENIANQSLKLCSANDEIINQTGINVFRMIYDLGKISRKLIFTWYIVLAVGYISEELFSERSSLAWIALDFESLPDGVTFPLLQCLCY